jgi:superfamily II DNA or RNA helicase
MPFSAFYVSEGIKIDEKILMERIGGRAELNKILKYLTIKEIKQPGRPRAYGERRAWKRSKGNIIVPNCQEQYIKNKKLVDFIRSSVSFTRPELRTINPNNWKSGKIAFYDYQELISEYIMDKFKNNNAAYIEMPPGFGKTGTSIAVAAKIQKPTLVIVPSKKLQKDWKRECGLFLPNIQVESYVNRTKNSKKKELTSDNYDILIGVINSMAAKPPEFFMQFGLVIIDEAHKLHSPTKMKLLWSIQAAPKILGLSATPEEGVHGLDRIIKHFISKPIEVFSATKELRAAYEKNKGRLTFNGIVREIKYYGEGKYCEVEITKAGTMDIMSTIQKMGSEPNRLKMACEEVMQLYNLHENLPPDQLIEYGLGPRPKSEERPGFPAGETRMHYIFVFSETRQLLDMFKKYLLEHYNLKAELEDELEMLRGGASDEQLANANKVRIILTTYGYSSVGVSIKDASAVVFYTPRKNNMKQISGRITRAGSDTKTVRIIVDIKDMRSPLCRQSTTRRKAYKLKNYIIRSVKYDNKLVPFGKEKIEWTPVTNDDMAESDEGVGFDEMSDDN